MRYADIRKKGPARWPWGVGLAALALIVWGVTVLLAPPEEEQGPDPGTTVADTQPPSPIPVADRQMFTPDGGADLDRLAPLGEDDAGRQVRLDGEVMAADGDGYWILAGSHLIRVRSTEPVGVGGRVVVRGVLEAADLDAPDIDEGRAGDRAAPGGWSVVRALTLVEERNAERAAASSGS